MFCNHQIHPFHDHDFNSGGNQSLCFDERGTGTAENGYRTRDPVYTDLLRIVWFSLFLALYWLSQYKEPAAIKDFKTVAIVFAVVDLILAVIDSDFVVLLELAAIVLVAHKLLNFTLGKSFGVLGICIGLTLVGGVLAGVILGV